MTGAISFTNVANASGTWVALQKRLEEIQAVDDDASLHARAERLRRDLVCHLVLALERTRREHHRCTAASPVRNFYIRHKNTH